MTPRITLALALSLCALGCGAEAADDSGAAGSGGQAGSGSGSGSGGTSSGGFPGMGGSSTGGSGGSAGAPVTETGIPFGPYALWKSTTQIESVGTESFDMGMGASNANSLVKQIDAARSMNQRLTLAMTGGSHENYLTDGVFDLGKWKAKMQTYDTPEIHAAIEEAVADGTIVGNSVMDEPHVSGYGDGNTWGPKGTMTKKKVDDLCAYVKDMFPTLPVGVAHNHTAFEPENSYEVCEFIMDQYSTRFGELETFRDDGVAMAKRDGYAVYFSINILDGGTRADDGSWTCPLSTTGGKGTYSPNCRMNPEQVREFGTTLGLAACAMTMWRYDESFMADPDNQDAFADVAAALAAAPRTPCTRQ